MSECVCVWCESVCLHRHYHLALHLAETNTEAAIFTKSPEYNIDPTTHTYIDTETDKHFECNVYQYQYPYPYPYPYQYQYVCVYMLVLVLGAGL